MFRVLRARLHRLVFCRLKDHALSQVSSHGVRFPRLEGGLTLWQCKFCGVRYSASHRFYTNRGHLKYCHAHTERAFRCTDLREMLSWD